MMVSYTRARAEAAGIKMESVGFAERAERMLILAVVSIIAILLVTRIRLRYSVVGGAFKLDSYTKSIFMFTKH